MTDIREGLAEILSEKPDSWLMNETITYLRSEGVVQKVEGELPELDNDWLECLWKDYDDGDADETAFKLDRAVETARMHERNMLKAGYTLTEEIK